MSANSFARYDGAACPSVGGVSVGRAGVYRRRRYIVGTHGRRGESCRRIHSPLFARYDGVACPSVGGVSVGRAGIYRRCRYIVGTHDRRGESCRRIHSPLFARYDGAACPSVGGGPSVGPGNNGPDGVYASMSLAWAPSGNGTAPANNGS